MLFSDNQITSITGINPVCFWFNGSFPSLTVQSARTEMSALRGRIDLDYLSKPVFDDSDSRILDDGDPRIAIGHPERTRTSVFHFESSYSDCHSHSITTKHHLSHAYSVKHRKKKPKHLKRSGALESLS
ncbi:MAG: hypothetical protein AAF824_05635 [Bacteroidota bacterium]